MLEKLKHADLRGRAYLGADSLPTPSILCAESYHIFYEASRLIAGNEEKNAGPTTTSNVHLRSNQQV
jgi:hypothetical protein